jgi:hypothetical protein
MKAASATQMIGKPKTQSILTVRSSKGEQSCQAEYGCFLFGEVDGTVDKA